MPHVHVCVNHVTCPQRKPAWHCGTIHGLPSAVCLPVEGCHGLCGLHLTADVCVPCLCRYWLRLVSLCPLSWPPCAALVEVAAANGVEAVAGTAVAVASGGAAAA